MTSNTPDSNTGESNTGETSTGKSITGKRKGLAVGLTLGLLGGTAAGLVLGVPGLSSAADSDSPAVIVQQVDETDDAEAKAPGEPGERLREVLQPLVDDNTITAGQADDVTSHLIENGPERGNRGGPGEHRRGHRRGVSEAVLELLGTDAESLREQIKDGSSLADIAAAAGVDVEQLTLVMLAEASEHLDEAVANGRIDETEAAEKLAQIQELITARINGEFPGRPGD